MLPNMKSAAMKHAMALALSGSVGIPKVKQRRNAEAFLLPRKNIRPEPNIFASLLSIDPNTDAVLDHFKISDEAIFKLRELITTVCSSCWEVVLRSPKWDVTYEQVANLTKALHADLHWRGLKRYEYQSFYSMKLNCIYSPRLQYCCPCFSRFLAQWFLFVHFIFLVWSYFSSSCPFVSACTRIMALIFS